MALVMGVLGTGPAGAATRTTSTAPAPAVPNLAATGRSFGVALPDAPGSMASLQALADQLGRRPDRVMWYVAWSLGSDFPTQQATAVRTFGALPVITWEPWDPARGTDQPAYRLDAIASGAFDSYLTRWARQALTYGGPVVLRLAHEMNGSWYPWAAGVNGSTPTSYVAAWRHVVDVFRQQKATNVRWQWVPNVPYPGSADLASLYPGDGYVDEVGLDGYNWAGSLPGTTWVPFVDLFADGAQQVRALTAKPLYVVETGTPEEPGKQWWVRDMFTALKGSSTFAGVTWFSYAKEQDWRIDSSPESLAAFRDGLTGY
jgi:hypothetical protein